MTGVAYMRAPALSILAVLAMFAGAGAGVRTAGADPEKKGDGKSEEDDVDYLALAARLIKDGHFDRAESSLKQVDLKRPDVDLPRFHTLYGLVQLKQKRHADARASLQKALAAGQQDKAVHLFLAQAHYGLGDWRGTVASLDAAGPALTGKPEIHVMRAICHWNLRQYEQVFAILEAGFRRWPEATELKKMHVFYLIELGLYQVAVDEGLGYLSRADATAGDFVAVGEALKRAKQFDKAIGILEQARLRFPFELDVTIQLGHLYAEQEHPVAAANLFSQAAMHDDRYRLEAAELYRRAERLDLALAMNAGISDQEKKIKQRLGILLKMERFDLVVGMEDRLSRLGLLAKDDLRYALAYAYYSTGDFADAERHLKHLRDANLFDKATAIRQTMAKCREAGWECLP
jgi:tetratricopeptide (TPR) repeat protein